MLTKRVERLQEAAAASGLASVAVMPGPNFRYLTGMEMHTSGG